VLAVVSPDLAFLVPPSSCPLENKLLKSVIL